MMATVKPTSKFKKDFKRIRKDKEKVLRLMQFVEMLENDKEIPEENYPHKLKGEYKGCMECHIGPDFLLIWKNPETGIIYLVRVGSHSELF